MDMDQMILKFDAALNDPKIYKDIYKTNHNDAISQINNIESIRFRAIAGDALAESFMVDKLCGFIYSYKDDDEVSFIDFADPESNSNEIKLIMLCETLGISSVIEKSVVLDVFDENMLNEVFKKELSVIKSVYANYNEQTRLNARVIFSDIYGLGIIDFLRDEYINEIGVIRKDFIYVIIKGRKIRLKCVKIKSREALLNIIKKSVMNANTPFDRTNPICISSRHNTDRVAAAGFDVSPDDSLIYLNIRIFNLKSITLEELKDKYHTLNDEIYEFLVLNQKGKGSYFVTSADMNSGKSTLMLAMLQKLPDKFAIGIIDPQNEMRIASRYPDKNAITLISNDQKSTDECFEYLLKTSRDILSVSEVTNSNEVTQLINGALRLNCGICATMHSLSPREVVINLRNLMMRTNTYTNEKTALEDIERGIDLIIHLRRLNDRIVIDSIDEIISGGINRIFEYTGSDWIKKGKPTDRYKNKLFTYLDDMDMEKYQTLFGGYDNEN